jgi:hypothetical protein
MKNTIKEIKPISEPLPEKTLETVIKAIKEWETR